jgi:hypothetical protein
LKHSLGQREVKDIVCFEELFGRWRPPTWEAWNDVIPIAFVSKLLKTDLIPWLLFERKIQKKFTLLEN